MKTLTRLLAAVSLLTACTKEIPYEEVHKDQVYQKTVIDTSAEYVYVPSLTTASRTSKAARPYWMGDAKLVRLRLTEKTLQALEVEVDPRFQSNTTNYKLIFEVPVEHIEYRCSKDRHGDCTNREEKDDELHWSQRSRIRPNFDQANIAEVSLLPIEMENFLKGSCYSEVSSRLVDYELTPEAINFRIERTFNASIRCLDLSSIDSLSDFTTTAVFHYSLARLDRLASPNYKAALYPREDENTFGFFTTQLKKLDVDNNMTEDGEVVFMNRWNPEKREIVYYLSDEFAKKENYALKVATRKAFDKINQGLAEAGAKVRLTLKEPAGKQPGDIRNNMIVLVEDPVAASVIGYGPSVANPRTGEILSARTVMYLGTINRMVKYSYDEVRRSLLARKSGPLAKAAVSETIVAQAQAKKSQAVSTAQSLTKSLSKFSSNKGKAPLMARVPLNEVKKEISQYSRHVDMNMNNPEIFLAKHNACVLGAEMPTINTAIEEGLVKLFGKELKPWENLTESEKKSAMAVILPEVWTGTLIHEVGHNLGLRHNFGGSEDKDNFYTEAELKQMGIKHKIPYSSVMDYGASDLNVLPTLGKYDIAALRFAYAGKVEAKSNLVSVETTIADLKKKNIEIKEYRYCSDEHTDVNAGCKRFDEGTTLTEIAQSMIATYHKYYEIRNFRNKAHNFSQMSDLGYVSRIDNTFFNLRLFLETYERINNSFVISEEEWNSIEFLKDLREATLLTARFFIDVISTPDTLCAIVETKNPNVIIAVERPSVIDKSAMNCSELELRPEFKVVGEAGKSLLSKKSKHSNNPYADQIDVRGVWIDKVLALKYLLGRTIGSGSDLPSLNLLKDSYLDIEALQPEILSLMGSLLMNNVAKEITFKAADGSSFKIAAPYDVFESHLIPTPMDPRVNKALGIPARDVFLAEVMVLDLEKQAKERLAKGDVSKDLFELFGVHRTKAIFGQTTAPEGVKTMLLGEHVLGASQKNPIAANLMDLMQISTIFSQVEPTKVREILSAQVSGKPLPDTASEIEKVIYSMDKQILQMQLNGMIHSPIFYKTVLDILPTL